MSSSSDHLLQLEGTQLGDGWTVGELVKKNPKEDTGGNFSVCYLARRGSEEAFLKVMDFRRALRSDDIPRALQQLTAEFNYERDLLELCKHMSKIITAITTGTIKINEAYLDHAYYILFELAKGDIRKQLRIDTKLSMAWCCGALHEISEGLNQLHRGGVFHQDIKPSNVLIVDDENSIKIGNLGRAHCNIKENPFKDLTIPGAIAYAPPEQLYGYQLANESDARRAADMYHLGSMLYFFFAGQMLTPALKDELRREHLPANWTGRFEDVLPYLLDAFDGCLGILSDKLRATAPPRWAQQGLVGKMEQLFVQLSHPDPRQRGDPNARRTLQESDYNLQRVVSRLELLAKRARLFSR